MGLKEKLLENKRLNEENQQKVAEQQSRLSYELGYSDTTDYDVDYSVLYDPFVKVYADIQLKLQNNTSENPAYDRKYANDIVNSVQVITTALENILSNTEVWESAVINAGLMGGVDLMGTPNSRYRAMNVLSDNIKGIIEIHAENGNINQLAWDIYDEDGFVEKIYLNKLNLLSEKQDMYVSIPDVSKQNMDFKMLASNIFEQEQMGTDTPVLTGGVTETFRKKNKQGQMEIDSKDLGDNMVQDFYIVDKETISNNQVFNLEMNKIAQGILAMNESYDQPIAFNNNILAQVTDHYLKPAFALNKNQQNRFVEDYKKWFLETEIPNKFPLGEPKPKNVELPQNEIVEEQVQEEVVLP